MSHRKHVRVICYEPIAVDRSFKQTWSDCWLRWKTRPGRPEVSLGPTLICKKDLEFDLWLNRDVMEKNAGEPWIREIAKEITEYEETLTLLTKQPYVYGGDNNSGTPDVYTRAAYIDHAEAEKMLAFLLHHRFGIRRPKFLWEGHPKGYIVTPMSFSLTTRQFDDAG